MTNSNDVEKYCPTCGRPYPNRHINAGETVKRCPTCNHSVNRYDNYCRYCGSELRKECNGHA